MLKQIDDCAKRRLTDQMELRVAAQFLIKQGFQDHEIAVELSRYYYVDVDALNLTLDGLSMPDRSDA